MRMRTRKNEFEPYRVIVLQDVPTGRFRFEVWDQKYWPHEQIKISPSHYLFGWWARLEGQLWLRRKIKKGQLVA